MKFIETSIKGAYIIEIEPIEDERGFFARSWCKKEFEELGLDTNIIQCNISFNKKRGTLRGMHYQIEPYEEVKIVRCTKGSVYDVIIDLRPDSPTFKKWESIELTDDNRLMLYIPKGIAHGFQTLEDNSELLYQMSEFYVAEYARGVRWNDPAFNIKWPIAHNLIISPRDQSYPYFKL